MVPLEVDGAADSLRFIGLIRSTDWAEVLSLQAARGRELPNRAQGRSPSAGDLLLLHPVLGVVVSSVYAKEGRALRSTPVQSPFPSAKRLAFVGE